MRSNVPSERIRFCFPKMSGGGYMHSKLQLLKFKRYAAWLEFLIISRRLT